MQINADVGGPQPHPASAVWQVASKDLIAVAAWSQKRPGLGEDAEPTFIHHVPGRHGVLGVYDGLGGAGARHAGRARDGRQLTHAFVASRLAYLTVRSWFAAKVAGAPVPLSARLAEVLAKARSSTRNKVVGTLRRDFPTTLAVIEYQESGKQIEVTASWAGDSRCYLLTAENGLQQLSRDDTEIQDALELLIADQPMTNVVTASGDFVIHDRRLDVAKPCLLVCATDGFFGYVAAPALFEYVILNELNRSQNEGEWACNLAERVRGYTADDASIVLVALGFGSFKRLRERFTDRLRELSADHDDVLHNVGSRADYVAARQRSWDRYRPQYMRYVDWPAYPGSAAVSLPPSPGVAVDEAAGKGARP